MAEEYYVRCIVCPLGCLVRIVVDNQGVIQSLDGHQCKDGEQYAVDEFRNPARVLTATMLTAGSSHPLIPVRTNRPIPRARLLEGMRVLARVVVRPPVSAGDVIISHLLGTDADVVSTADLVNEDGMA